MQWRKLGRVFAPDGTRDWMRTHAANPVPEPLGGGEFRVYFGSRDGAGRSHVGSVDVELAAGGMRVLRVADEPVVAPSPPGPFDDSGASMGCLARDGDRTLLYYLGRNLGVTVPWRNFIGLAVRDRPGGRFVKHSPAPVLERSAADPFSLTYPCVVRDGGAWRMWYGSSLTWGAAEADWTHAVKAAESDDGVTWRRDGAVVVGLERPGEWVVNRPWVLTDAGRYRMWYCYRGDRYRIGYAESADGRAWARRDDLAGIDATPGAWDGTMVCYPCVFDAPGGRFMLYNGDGHGRTGFGLAVLEQD
jgi:hypothetical protein